VHLLPAVKRGGVYRDVAGTTPESVFREVLKTFPYPPEAQETPREALLASLLEREGMVSTAVGKGIAFPHPRHPQDWGLEGPTVGVCYLRQPVEFGALDGQPVTVLFILLCTTVKAHLTLLSQVSRFVNDNGVREFLATKPDVTALLERISHVLPSA
jgi:PTS system nitrogen regulatory IIA component